jgi:hypothetical protein
MLLFKRPLRAVRGKEIFDAGPPALDGLPQNCLHFMVEATGRGGREPAGDGIRVQARSKQRLIRINISDTRNDLLMH